eukprot:g7135.t1
MATPPFLAERGSPKSSSPRYEKHREKLQSGDALASSDGKSSHRSRRNTDDKQLASTDGPRIPTPASPDSTPPKSRHNTDDHARGDQFYPESRVRDKDGKQLSSGPSSSHSKSHHGSHAPGSSSSKDKKLSRLGTQKMDLDSFLGSEVALPQAGFRSMQRVAPPASSGNRERDELLSLTADRAQHAEIARKRFSRTGTYDGRPAKNSAPSNSATSAGSSSRGPPGAGGPPLAGHNQGSSNVDDKGRPIRGPDKKEDSRHKADVVKDDMRLNAVKLLQQQEQLDRLEEDAALMEEDAKEYSKTAGKMAAFFKARADGQPPPDRRRSREEIGRPGSPKENAAGSTPGAVEKEDGEEKEGGECSMM